MRASGLAIGCLAARGPFDLTRPGTWAQHRPFFERAVHTAAELDAECVMVTTGPAGHLPCDRAVAAVRAKSTASRTSRPHRVRAGLRLDRRDEGHPQPRRPRRRRRASRVWSVQRQRV